MISIATLYGVVGGARLSVPGQTDSDSHQASCAKATGFFPAGKVVREWS